MSTQETEPMYPKHNSWLDQTRERWRSHVYSWPEGKQPHVYAAIAEVSAALAEIGVGKSRENKQQGFKFRGVDDVYQVIATLLPKHALVILPRVLSRSMTERKSSAGNALFSVVCEVEYSLVSAKDGSEHVVRFIGEGMDTGDKATNKAIAIAYKYMAFQVFCIPLEGVQDDPDADSHKVEGKDGKADPPADGKKAPAARAVRKNAPPAAPAPAGGANGGAQGSESKTLLPSHVAGLWGFIRKLAEARPDQEALLRALLAKHGVAASKDLPLCAPGEEPHGIWKYFDELKVLAAAQRRAKEEQNNG